MGKIEIEKIKMARYYPHYNGVMEMAVPESRDEFEYRYKKFPAFRNADFTNEATEHGATKDSSGGSIMRSCASGLIDDGVYCVSNDGSLDTLPAENKSMALRPTLHLIYNEDSCVVKTQKFVSRESEVSEYKNDYQYGNCERKRYNGDAPVVEFGGNKYIWLNREDCLNNKSEVMDLIAKDNLDCARSFVDSYEEEFGDLDRLIYPCAYGLREQTNKVVFKNATPEELALVCPVFLRSKDEFSKAVPQKEKQIEGYIYLYDQCGAIDIEQLTDSIMLAQNKEYVSNMYFGIFIQGLKEDVKGRTVDSEEELKAAKTYGDCVKKLIQLREDEKAKENE